MNKKMTRIFKSFRVLMIGVFLQLYGQTIFADVPSCSDACTNASYSVTIYGETLPASTIAPNSYCKTVPECKCSEGTSKQQCKLSWTGPTSTANGYGTYECVISDPCQLESPLVYIEKLHLLMNNLGYAVESTRLQLYRFCKSALDFITRTQ